jgi:hypothetical protein
MRGLILVWSLVVQTFLGYFAQAATISDPASLLPQVSRFISTNSGPSCQDSAIKYRSVNYKVSCKAQQCDLLTAPLGLMACDSRASEMGCGLMRLINCNQSSINLIKEGAVNIQIGPIYLSDLYDASKVLDMALAVYVEAASPVDKPFAYKIGEDLYPLYGYAQPGQSTFTIQKLIPDTFTLHDGTKIPALRVVGSFKLAVFDAKVAQDYRRVMRTYYSTTKAAEIWLGQGVRQSSQVLNVLVDAKPLFQLY